MRRPYFPTIEDAPKPLCITTKRNIRFQEVDAMGIVWHGTYPSYLEDARLALGNRYGVGYSDFMKNNMPAPIKQMHIDYCSPLYFEDEIEIEAIQHWSDAARINFEFIIRKAGKVAATGYSVQMMLKDNFEILLTPPQFYLDFMEKWKAGLLD